MARSYKSALPTWSTYTPHISPMGAQAPINQETFWRNRARQWQVPSSHGEFGRIADFAFSQTKGTGAGGLAAAGPQHRPIMGAIQGAIGSRQGAARDRRAWADQVREALQQQTPEAITEEGETTPQAPMQVRAARTAAPTVNPADVQQAQAARQVSGTLLGETMASSNAGSTRLNVPASFSRRPGPTSTINRGK